MVIPIKIVSFVIELNYSNTMYGKMKDFLSQTLAEIKEAGLYKEERLIESAQQAAITVKGKEVLNFCANNYLGLSNHPRLIKASQEMMNRRGYGMSSVRFICGTQDIHKELEAAISDYFQTEDTILYAACFDANGGVFEPLFTEEDAIISDSLNHASIIDGVRLCKAKRYRYANADMKDLERCLQEAQAQRFRIVVTDGVFSMDGDVAPLKEICVLADKYNALVWIDESHSAGFFGKTGRGTPEYCGVQGRIDFINSTMGKAMGGASGGYTCASKEVVTLLRQKSRPYLFSNTLAPSLVGAAIKTYSMLMESSSLPERVLANTHLFRDRMTAAGFTLAGAYDHPICPVMLGDAALACKFADKMLEKGIYVIGFSYPVVPMGKARIRTQMSGAHTLEQVNRCVDAFIEVGKELGVIA